MLQTLYEQLERMRLIGKGLDDEKSQALGILKGKKEACKTGGHAGGTYIWKIMYHNKNELREEVKQNEGNDCYLRELNALLERMRIKVDKRD